jgi:hypothetical protein
VGSPVFDIEDFSTTYIFVKCILFMGESGWREKGEKWEKLFSTIFHFNHSFSPIPIFYTT